MGTRRKINAILLNIKINQPKLVTKCRYKLETCWQNFIEIYLTWVKILQKVLGGLLFLDSHCTFQIAFDEYVCQSVIEACTPRRNGNVKMSELRVCLQCNFLLDLSCNQWTRWLISRRGVADNSACYSIAPDIPYDISYRLQAASMMRLNITPTKRHDISETLDAQSVHLRMWYCYSRFAWFFKM